MDPEVTFVIPCYNERDYLGRCLASICAQTLDREAVETIVVDNGSSDGTRELAASWGARVLLNERHGAAASRNLGAAAARAPLVAFVDADCIIPPEWASTLSAHLGTGKVAAAGAPAVPVTERMTWVEQGWCSVFVCLARGFDRGVASVGNLPSSNLLIPREHFQAVGGFDEAMLSCEDYDISLRLLRHGTLVLDENLSVLHLRESKTVAELFRREVGRGRYSLRCFVKNGCRLRELPSTAIPCATLLAVVTLPVVATLRGLDAALLLLLFLLTIPATYLVRSGQRPRGVKSALAQYAVSATYVAARCAALARELCDIALRNRR